LSKSCPRFQFEITYELTISYCKNCEGLCRNNKALSGALDPYLLEKSPLDMLDDFTDDTKNQLNAFLNELHIVCIVCKQHFASTEVMAEHKCPGKPLFDIETNQNKQNAQYVQIIWPKDMFPAS
jgi:hypothetical protein